MPSYTLEATLPVSFDEALTRLRAAAAAQGFGVLYELDFSGIIAAKTGSTLPGGRVTSLGLCDPRLAREALILDPALAALLPCGAFVAETP
ncbi:MAG TPA: DUF302 domain-containing protein, partial [Deinococcales bacterium]|nr:DUF302 domain-containing protein [Deinococcales bacterium]